MIAIILSIGDELVLGQTVDTNSAWISRELAAVGLRTAAHATVGDDQKATERAIISAAAGQCDALIISGGLGPTEDDLTRQAIAAVLGVELEVNPQAMETLTAFFRRIKRPMAESNKVQAMIPRGATLIENTCGTAPGIDAIHATGDLKHSCRLFAMPGVPREMKAMFARDVLPQLAKAAGGAAIVSRTLHTFGVGESNVGETLGELMRRGRNPSVGTTVANGIVSVRVNSHFDSREKATEELERTVHACRAVLGDLIFGQDDQTLAEGVADLLVAKGEAGRLAVAESGTDGALAKMLSDVPESGRFFEQGWVVASNHAKITALGVSPQQLGELGPVAGQVAETMATTARELACTPLALAVTGAADAAGPKATRPFGLFAIALAHPGGTTSREFQLSGDRDLIRDRAAKMALSVLRFHLLGKPLPF